MTARITHLDIEGLRVIDRLSLELHQMNVLIGENGSGKSTVLEALEILRKAAAMSGPAWIEDLYQVHHSEQLFRGGGESGGAKRLKLGVRLLLEENLPCRYSVTFRMRPGGWISIIEEHLTLDYEGHSKPLWVIQRSEDRARVFNQKTRKLEAISLLHDNQLLLSSLGASPGEVLNHSLPQVRAALEAIRVHPVTDVSPAWTRRPNEPPAPMRGISQVRPASKVERNGANLPNVYLELRNRGTEPWQHLLSTLRLGLGHEVEDVLITPSPSGTLSLALKFRGLGPVPANALSDGQLAFLLAVAIFEFEQGGLVAFDEPDAYFHPTLIDRFVDRAEVASERCTVVIATHSDRLLNALFDPLQSVVLFERDGDLRTRALRPNAEQLAYWLEKYRGIGTIRAEGYSSILFTEDANVSADRAEPVAAE